VAVYVSFIREGILLMLNLDILTSVSSIWQGFLLTLSALTL